MTLNQVVVSTKSKVIKSKGGYKSGHKFIHRLANPTGDRILTDSKETILNYIITFMASRNGPCPKSHTQQETRTCLCSPTTHPGSFRCGLHRDSLRVPARSRIGRAGSNNKGGLALVAKANSFKAILLQIIKPSSHDLHRRRDFQPRLTRFCLMNTSRDGFAVS